MRACVVEVDAVLRSTGAAATLYLSDIGYVDQTVNPPICYLPHLDQPFSGDRQLPIGPEAGTAVGATWGDIVFDNPRDPVTGVGLYDGLIDTVDVAGRAVRVAIVDKVYDPARGIWTDQTAVSAAPVIFSGAALNWVTDGKQINLRIRDNLAVIEQPIQTAFYAGTGGANGTAANANQPKPKLRGLVDNATPILIDPTNNVYQINDAAYSGETIYEGGIAGFTNVGNFATYAALIAATIAAGQYATAHAVGLFALGTAPTYDITFDAQGSFPSGAASTNLITIAESLLHEDCGIASAAINTANFTAMATNLGANGGIYTGTGNPTAIDMLNQLMGGLSCAIGTDLNGIIDIFILGPPGGATVVDFTAAQIVDCQSADLPDSVAVPNWRRTLSYSPNGTVQSGNTLKPTVTQARRQFLSQPYSRAAVSIPANKTKWPTALDAPIIVSCIIGTSEASALLTTFIGPLWETQRYLYDLTFPLQLIVPAGGAICDIGDEIGVTYPVGKLASGQDCIVVGFTPDAKANTVVLRVFL